jgi:hypothetical protein
MNLRTIAGAPIMAEIPAAFSTTIDRPPSCVEFLPSDTTYAFIGTYALEKSEAGYDSETQEFSETTTSLQKRSGSLVIMSLKEGIESVIRTWFIDTLTGL